MYLILFLIHLLKPITYTHIILHGSGEKMHVSLKIEVCNYLTEVYEIQLR